MGQTGEGLQATDTPTFMMSSEEPISSDSEMDTLPSLSSDSPIACSRLSMERRTALASDFRRFSSRSSRPLHYDEEAEPSAYEYSEDEEDEEDYIGEDDDEEWGKSSRKKAKKTAKGPVAKAKKRPAPRKSRIVSDDEEEDDEDESTDSYGSSDREERKEKKKAISTGEIAYPLPEPPIESVLAERRSDSGAPEFLVKWQGRSHRRCTWEAASRVLQLAPRKLDSYHRRCLEQGTEDDLLSEHELHCLLERVIAESEDGRLYLCKWTGLPYSGCTWESKGSLEGSEEDRACVDAFLVRRAERVVPSAPKRRPAFQKMEVQPACLSTGGTLRDYQLEGINWLVYTLYILIGRLYL